MKIVQTSSCVATVRCVYVRIRPCIKNRPLAKKGELYRGTTFIRGLAALFVALRSATVPPTYPQNPVSATLCDVQRSTRRVMAYGQTVAPCTKRHALLAICIRSLVPTQTYLYIVAYILPNFTPIGKQFLHYFDTFRKLFANHTHLI